jgi:hypothetical protein
MLIGSQRLPSGANKAAWFTPARGLITLRRELGKLLTPANSNANQNSYANSDRECSKRASFGLSCNPTQSIIAGPGTDLDCLIPKLAACRLPRAGHGRNGSTMSFRIGQIASAIWLPAVDALADAFRLALFPIPPSSFFNGA